MSLDSIALHKKIDRTDRANKRLFVIKFKYVKITGFIYNYIYISSINNIKIIFISMIMVKSEVRGLKQKIVNTHLSLN